MADDNATAMSPEQSVRIESCDNMRMTVLLHPGAGRVCQWLDTVPAAMAWAVRQRLPRTPTLSARCRASWHQQRSHTTAWALVLEGREPRHRSLTPVVAMNA